MKIDCFPYFNEKELLELRIKLLNDKVDRFIITEADHTHSGKPKQFNLLQTLRDIDVPLNKILYVPVLLPSVEKEPNHWVRERMQRDACAQYIDDNDIVFMGDCDEILNPKHVDYMFSIKKQHPNNILRTPMAYLCGRADLRAHDNFGNPISWNTPFIASGKQLKRHSPSKIREDHAWRRHSLPDTDIYILENGEPVNLGWHLTWMGNIDRLITKEDSYCHSGEFSVSATYVAKEGSTDPLGRSDHVLKRYHDEDLNHIINANNKIREFLIP